MLRSVAVARIQEGLGFRTTLSAQVISRLQEAQRDLEAGKTLPRFLVVEDATFTIPAGEHSAPLPAGFLRIDDENLPHSGNMFLQPRRYQDAVEAYGGTSMVSVAKMPKVFVIRKSVLDVIVPMGVDVTFTWSYFKAAVVLSADVENAWLADTRGGSEWLIGEAGWRLAMDLRDQEAAQIFDRLRTSGRAASFGEFLVADTQSGGVAMGEAN